MIKTEAAHKEIEKHIRKKAPATSLAAVKKLPKKLKTIGLFILGKDEAGKHLGYWDRDEQCGSHAATFDSLSVAERAKIVKCLTPSLVAEVERAYQFCKSLPISGEYGESMLFRAKATDPDALKNAATWAFAFLGDALAIDPKTLTSSWIATWAAHFDYGLGLDMEIASTLLASEISHGGKNGAAVFELIRQSATREHDIAAMGEHVPATLLMATNPDGWTLIEGMLLAAQRQEGLRQSILSATREAQPEAFIRMLKVMKDNKLVRFSAVAQAFNLWFGFGWDSASVSVINKILDSLIQFVEVGVPAKVWNGDDGEAVYLGLWTVGINDVSDAIAQTKKLLANKTPEVRFAAIHYLSNVSASGSKEPIAAALLDEDDRVQAIAIEAFRYGDDESKDVDTTLAFEALEGLLATAPAKTKKLKPILWPWILPTINREKVGTAMVSGLGNLPPSRLIRSLKLLDASNRRWAIGKMVEEKKWDDESRAAIVAAIGDSSGDVRETALGAFKKRKLNEQEVERVEVFLKRQGSDLRNSIITLLLKQNDTKAIVSGQRLLESKSGPQRLAGLELLRQMSESDRSRKRCVEVVSSWQAGRGKSSKEENVQINAILESDREPISLDNALGLSHPENRAAAIKPSKKSVKYVTPIAIKVLKELDALVHQHRNEEVEMSDWRDEKQMVKLGSDPWFPHPDEKKPVKEELKRLPMADVWFGWLAKRPKSLKDSDGLEIYRASRLVPFSDSWDWRSGMDWAGKNAERKKVLKTLLGTDKRVNLKYESVVNRLLDWFLFVQPPKKLENYLLDACENLMALIPSADVEGLAKPKKDRWGDSVDWRDDDAEVIESWIRPIQVQKGLNQSQKKRRYQLLRWFEQPIPEAKRVRMPFSILMEGYEAKAANIDDVADHILGPVGERWGSFGTLQELTARRLSKENQQRLKKHPEIADFVGRCRERIIELELQRGEKETAATDAASNLGAVFGTDVLIRLLAELGKTGFKKDRSWRTNTTSKPVSLTNLVGSCYPGPEDTPQDFAKKLKKAVSDGTIPEERILQLAFQAPQWTLFVEAYLNWDGFSEGLYWFLAHMKYVWGGFDDAAVGTEYDEDDDAPDEEDDDDEDALGRERLSPWDRLILQRTSLTDVERREGGVDVQWFKRTRAGLTDKRWDAMADAARYAATAAQAKRARYIADVLTGRADRKELIDQIEKRKLKENVRLLGLLPLAKGKVGEKDLLERYEILQQYRKYAKTLSGLTKPDAMRACDIGFENLSRTAGFPDPLRLEWALEAASTKDLNKGMLEVSKGDVTMLMELDAKSLPIVTITRGAKVLKSLPTSHRKDADMVALRERAKEIKRQAIRSRHSLESAMCRRDEIVGSELQKLAQHHLLWPMLSRLIIVGEGIMGYPDKRGKALRDHAGKLEPVKAAEKMRVAHPHDLLKSKAWAKWQHDCFIAERIQPFKQVFRELYVLTAQEKKDKSRSSRYAGQQVNPKQAFALWGSRGWHTRDEIWKAFPNEGLTVHVEFEWAPGSPSEIEGLTLDTISFRKRDSYDAVPLKDIDPIVFSEVMRDIDLVVSVAHRGEVDPEASASTTEMRTSLINQTCQLLGIKNVSLKKSHATIRGGLGDYSVHLGSGLVHRMPGGHVCIVPVHAQHRGRLFLPFADDDPKTAEIVSKILLLAKDEEIQDPTILEQIRAAAS